MKKRIITFILLFVTLFITGCEESNNKELDKKLSESIDIDDNGAALVCKTDIDYSEYNYTLGSKYVVFTDDKEKVVKVVSTEIINSNDQSKLDEFETYLNKNHDAAVQYNGYTFDVKRESNMVKSTVTIDYNEFDIKKFIKDNEITNQTEELTLDSIEKQYISLGADCERK